MIKKISLIISKSLMNVPWLSVTLLLPFLCSHPSNYNPLLPKWSRIVLKELSGKWNFVITKILLNDPFKWQFTMKTNTTLFLVSYLCKASISYFVNIPYINKVIFCVCKSCLLSNVGNSSHYSQAYCQGQLIIAHKNKQESMMPGQKQIFQSKSLSLNQD